MFEDLVLKGYNDFWHAVPAMARSLERSDEIRMLRFTGSAIIGSHEATFFSLLAKPRRPKRLKLLLLSPLAIGEIARRGKTSGHAVKDYVERILTTLETLQHLRSTGALEVEVRLYRRDPQWYFWIFEDSVFVDSHALGVGRRAPRLQLFNRRARDVQELFTTLFDKLWTDRSNQTVDFSSANRELAELRRDALAATDTWSGAVEKDGLGDDFVSPSVLKIACETYAHWSDVHPVLRRDFEKTTELCHYGSTAETNFGTDGRDLVRALAENQQGGKLRFSLLSPDASLAVGEKVRYSTSGRSLDQTRAAILRTVSVLGRLKEGSRLDLEIRTRRELGSTRLFLFDDSVCLSAFEKSGDYPSPIVVFREHGQDHLVSFFRRHFLESWDASVDRSPTSVCNSAAAVPISVDTNATERHAIEFDAQKLVLTIDDVPRALSGGVLHMLWRIASERGAFLPMDESIDGRPAKRRRAALGTELGTELAREVIQTTQGFGYRFQPCVRVRGIGEVGLRMARDMDRYAAADE